MREISKPSPARQMLATSYVSTKQPVEPWTIPFHIIMWATLLCGLIMTIVVVLMN